MTEPRAHLLHKIGNRPQCNATLGIRDRGNADRPPASSKLGSWRLILGTWCSHRPSARYGTPTIFGSSGTARDELGFEWVTPHTFRKTVGTLLEASSGMAMASAQLGHSSENVTRKHYVQETHEAPDNTTLLEAFGQSMD